MKQSMKRFSHLFVLSCISVLVSFAVGADLIDYNPVTAERLLDPEARNWLMYRGTYDSWGYSSLDQIRPDNVADLIPAWTFSTPKITSLCFEARFLDV